MRESEVDRLGHFLLLEFPDEVKIADPTATPVDVAIGLLCHLPRLRALLRRWRDDFDAYPADPTLDEETIAAVGPRISPERTTAPPAG